MRAINYFKKRFEYALKGNGTIKINQNDIDALNQLIDHANGQEVNTNLEDALLLFFVMSQWKIELADSVIKFKERGSGNLNLSPINLILEGVLAKIQPKEQVVKHMVTDLQTAQTAIGVARENLIPEGTVFKVLEEALANIKAFEPIKTLKSFKNFIIDYKAKPIQS